MRHEHSGLYWGRLEIQYALEQDMAGPASRMRAGELMG